MQQTDTLIRTKLRLPLARQGLVLRPRLQKRITQGLRGPLTLVTAPAGFGKTTLAAACIADSGKTRSNNQSDDCLRAHAYQPPKAGRQHAGVGR
jgi:ATP/maltotriose-dependent transcriptional regulator MalT